MIFSAEWTYLLTTRKVGGEDSAFSYVRIKYGSNATDTVTGVIIYPDDFSFSEVGVATMKFGANYAITQIDAGTWQMLEEAGCVFLPGSSYRNLSSAGPSIAEGVYGCNTYYWHASAVNAANGGNSDIGIGVRYLNTLNIYNYRYFGFSVRLVQDL